MYNSVYIKSKIFPGLDSTPHVHSRVSNFNFDLGVFSINISCNIPNSKVLVHFGFKSNVLPGSLNVFSGSDIVYFGEMKR